MSALPRRRGRYVLHQEFAAGGMASVLFGQLIGPVGFSRVVAVKRMHDDFSADPQFVKMFVDEAWMAARVQHPNVVAVLEVVADAGEILIVMDYVRGESLSSLLKLCKEPVPADVAASIVGQTLAGLHAAHEARDESGRPLGMIHRDISPQNILIGVDGLARITDFGIAKAASRLTVTMDKQVKGKLRYMPPEQLISDSALDRRADIYAAGVVLWETLAGRRLYPSDSVEELLASMTKDRMPSLFQARPDLPPSIDDVVRGAIVNDPNARYSTALEFQIALEKVLPIASGRAVGAWVETWARDRLREKQAFIDVIEQNTRSHEGITRELERLKEGEAVSTSEPAFHDETTTADPVAVMHARAASPEDTKITAVDRPIPVEEDDGGFDGNPTVRVTRREVEQSGGTTKMAIASFMPPRPEPVVAVLRSTPEPLQPAAVGPAPRTVTVKASSVAERENVPKFLQPPPAPPLPTLERAPRPTAPGAPRRWPLFVIAVGGALVGAAATFMIAGRRVSEAPAPSAAPSAEVSASNSARSHPDTVPSSSVRRP